MATIKRKQGVNQFGGAVPFGNLTTLAFAIATNAAGAVIDSNSTAAVAVGDVIELGTLPAGMRLEDAQVIVTTGMTAAVTGKLGFKYIDGEPLTGTAEAEDDAYFLAAGAVLNAAGRLRATGTKLITLPKPAVLVLTVAGAANAKASDIKVIVTGELQGAR